MFLLLSNKNANLPRKLLYVAVLYTLMTGLEMVIFSTLNAITRPRGHALFLGFSVLLINNPA